MNKNKKFTLVSLVIILVTLTACQSPSALANNHRTAKVYEITPEITRMMDALPTNLTIPAVLPSTIQDPRLLEAWIRLYNHQETVQLSNGSTLTGRDLAQFLLDQSIPVMWDTNQVCGAASCSVRYAHEKKGTWDFEDGKPGADPIFINPTYKTQDEHLMERLVGTLAHEAFHRTLPFGKVRDTLYEEFVAYHIGAEISQSSGLNFKGYDALNPSSLQRWFNDNDLMYAYEQFDLYPQKITVFESAPTLNNTSSLESDFTCHTDPYGLVTCQ